jgi:Sec-independent protein translocase protein TatA
MTGWIIGFAIGGVVVVIVVVLLLLMIVGARKVAGTAEAILAALHEARDNTQPLWRVSATNATATRIVVAATTARQALEGQPLEGDST